MIIKVINFSIKVLVIMVFVVASVAHAQIKKNIRYLEAPTAYENKKSTSFKVIQVFDDGALAREESEKYSGYYYGKTVMILGDLFYDEQIVEIKNPMFVGLYKYSEKTVPVIKPSSKPSEKEDTEDPNDAPLKEHAKTGLSNSWTLDGRSIRGVLAKPVYGDHEEGTIVIRIMVNENGDVILAEIAPGTDVTSKNLRNAAIAAAKKTKFNAISTKNNQSGTITYKFELR